MKTIGLRIKEARIAKNLKQEELAERIGAKSSAAVSSWEVGKAKPDCVTLLNICQVLNISPDELLGYNKNVPTLLEWSMIHKYREMDDFGKQAVESIINIEYERVSNTFSQKQKKARVLRLDYFTMPASAGTGIFLDSEEAEDIYVPESPEAEEADFVLSVKGNSMEPTFNDGDKIYVRKQDTVDIGEIGIFVLNGDVYVKELGNGKLISHNEEYKPMIIGDDDSCYCCGKVLGTV